MSMWKMIRLKSGMKQHEIAKKLNYTRAWVSNIENGKVKPSYKFQIFYLKLDGEKKHKIIIDYLTELYRKEES